MTQELTRDDYAANLNTDFVVEFNPEMKITMQLIEATEVLERFRQRTYSLLFQAPADTPIAQGMLNIEHEKLGQFNIFLVPVGKDDRGVLFESVFNQLMERT